MLGVFHSQPHRGALRFLSDKLDAFKTSDEYMKYALVNQLETMILTKKKKSKSLHQHKFKYLKMEQRLWNSQSSKNTQTLALAKKKLQIPAQRIPTKKTYKTPHPKGQLNTSSTRFCRKKR